MIIVPSRAQKQSTLSHVENSIINLYVFAVAHFPQQMKVATIFGGISRLMLECRITRSN